MCNKNRSVIKRFYTKSQSAVEFITLASFMLLVSVGFFAVISSNISEAQNEGNKKVAEDISVFAYKEIETAKSLNDGYVRVFTMPQTVNGVAYNISIIDNRELVVNYLGNEYVRFLPSNVTGNIEKGSNIITKYNGIVHVGSNTLSMLLMKNANSNIINFNDNGDVVLKGKLTTNVPQPPSTGNNQFIFKDSSGNNLVVIDLDSGNMEIAGNIFESQQSLNPSQSANNFIVNDPYGNVISYFDQNGNWYIKGVLTQKGNP